MMLKQVRRNKKKCKSCLVQQSDNSKEEKDSQCRYWCPKFFIEKAK